MSIGVLAFGSLIDEPGCELAAVEAERRSGVRTPFRVEFARSSTSRDSAPTLVPVTEGGAYVEASLIVLHDAVTLDQARDMVYRRETDHTCDMEYRYKPDPDRKNQVYVEVIPDCFGLDWVVYTRIAANVEPLTAEELAKRAIESAKKDAGKQGRDGITYLRNALANGIRTPLSADYERLVLEGTGTADLEEAKRKLLSFGDEADSG